MLMHIAPGTAAKSVSNPESLMNLAVPMVVIPLGADMPASIPTSFLVLSIAGCIFTSTCHPIAAAVPSNDIVIMIVTMPWDYLRKPFP
jgi:hypothetical protein